LNKINNIFGKLSLAFIRSMSKISFLYLGILFFIAGCSQDNYSLVNRTYHNTTAHYNAYFLAREKMKEVDLQIWQANADNYNKVLKIYPDIDKTIQSSIAPGLEEIIKKAALPVTKHKNSKWVDDSYLLIGKARLYQLEHTLALETFKFINTKGQDIHARHAALILLMRTFIITHDYESANSVFNYLKKENLNKVNSSDFYLTRGYQYSMLEDYKKAEPYLTLAVSDIKKKDFRARVHFIIGQVNQLFGNNKEAFINYNQVLKNNPPYELSFYAKLYRTQVSELDNNKDKKKVEKYFKKLLKDAKNAEYKDKIYYEMGMFEFKQGNTKEAISNFEKSLMEKSKNNFQKAVTYLRLGKIYYETLQNYEMAKLYYDSTVSVWDPKDKEFRLISQRQKVLDEFVTQLRIVQNQDSLQKLAAMDSTTLHKFLDHLIAENERKQKEDAKKAKDALEREERIKLNAANNGGISSGMPSQQIDNSSGQKWYFYNSTLMASGRTEFIKKWGNRPLEDNWRRTVKEKPTNLENAETITQDTATAKTEIVEKTPEEIRNETRGSYLKDIPSTPEQLAASNDKLEDALYNLGKIYNLKLEEPDNAIATFEKYIAKFEERDNAAEVLYFLYLLYKEQKNEQRTAELQENILKKFPNSIYAKIIRNPDYLNEAKVANLHASAIYKTAYNIYKDGHYLAADSLIEKIKKNYPENDIMDKVSFLQALVTGKTKNELAFKGALENFIRMYNTSSLIPKAKEYLTIADSFISGKTKTGANIDSNAVHYNPDLNFIHYFAAVYPSNFASSDAEQLFRVFNERYFNDKDLKLEVFALSDSSYMLLVKEFPDNNEAKRYLIEARNDEFLSASYPEFKNAVFVITEPNMALLRRSKYWKDYMKFYLEKYQ
jgi:tetratricopeptide (TPR) repeat protein